jgi:hypothetical protein
MGGRRRIKRCKFYFFMFTYMWIFRQVIFYVYLCIYVYMLRICIYIYICIYTQYLCMYVYIYMYIYLLSLTHIYVMRRFSPVRPVVSSPPCLSRENCIYKQHIHIYVY